MIGRIPTISGPGGKTMKVRYTAFAAIAPLVMVLASASVAPASPAKGKPSWNHSWNGYTTHYTRKTKVKAVTAEWNVPKLKCGNGVNASQWIGLGGVGSPLVQVGTVSTCTDGVEATLAFYEVVPKTNPSAAAPHYLTGIVTAGDYIDATVNYHGGNRYTVHFTDNSWEWDSAKNVTQPGYSATPAEADWIIEASKHPLANFGTTTFTDAFYNSTKLLIKGEKFEAGVSGGLQTSVSAIGQYGGAGPHFSIKWRRG
jgi:hypothetical protein